MKASTRNLLTKLLRDKFDSLTMSYEQAERLEIIQATKEICEITAHQMEEDEKI